MRQLIFCFVMICTVTIFQLSPDAPARNVYAQDTIIGEEVYKKSCMSCHGADGNSGRAPDLVSESFKSYFKTKTDLKEVIQKSMPRNAPGSLTEEEYQAVTEYVWGLNSKASTKPEGITVFVNGTKLVFPVSPILQNGTTVVPLREIFEALGASVTWEQSTRTVTASKGQTTVKLIIGKQQATKNKQTIQLSKPAQIIQGKTFVPLRFVSEAMGAKVEWNGKTQVIQITTP